jgi:hypothetical protein
MFWLRIDGIKFFVPMPLLGTTTRLVNGELPVKLGSVLAV